MDAGLIDKVNSSEATPFGTSVVFGRTASGTCDNGDCEAPAQAALSHSLLQGPRISLCAVHYALLGQRIAAMYAQQLAEQFATHAKNERREADRTLTMARRAIGKFYPSEVYRTRRMTKEEIEEIIVQQNDARLA